MDITTSLDGIISEFEHWARRQRRQVSTSVIERLLAARPASLGSPRQVWRSGDVAPAVDAAVDTAPVAFLLGAEPLEETLDAWFRFLRNTGRLGSGSADVGVLRREARRAARAAKERAVALVQPLVQPLVEDMAEARDDAEDEWDDPDDLRHENLRILRAMGIDRFDVLARTWGTLPDPERAADEGWSSDYMARLRHVAQAISPSVPMESLIFPSSETAEQLVRACPPGTFAGEALQPAPRDPGSTVLSSAFMSVWFDAEIAGMVEIVDGRAVPGPAYFGDADETAIRRTLRAVRVGCARIDDLLERSEHGAGLVCLMVRSLWGGCSWISVQETVEATPRPWFADRSEAEGSRRADFVREAIRELADAGLLRVDGDRARLTSFGVWAVDGWLCRQFDPDAW